MAWQAAAHGFPGSLGLPGKWPICILVVWNFFYVSHIFGIIIQTDELIFFRGIETINRYVVDLMGLNEVFHGHQTWLGNPWKSPIVRSNLQNDVVDTISNRLT